MAHVPQAIEITNEVRSAWDHETGLPILEHTGRRTIMIRGVRAHAWQYRLPHEDARFQRDLAQNCWDLDTEHLQFLRQQDEAWRVYACTLGGAAAPAPVAASPLPGYLCEVCLDAPAVSVTQAPWGGEMGVCADCQGDAR